MPARSAKSSTLTAIPRPALRNLGSGCSQDKDSHYSERPVPTDKMEYWTDPGTKDKISLLGYGCMRLPVLPKGQFKPDSNNENHSF